MPGLVVDFDPSFFHKKIFDHPSNNLLGSVSSSCLSAVARLASIRGQVKSNTHYAGEELKRIKKEISRNNSYRFSAIDGDVTFESFILGLRKIGVINPEAIDFLVLFNLQGSGGLTFTISPAILGLFIKFWLQSEIDYKQDWQYEFNQSTKRPHITTFTLVHRFISRDSENELVRLKIIAEIDNNNLQVDFKEMHLIIEDESSKAFLEQYLLELGYKKLHTENHTSNSTMSHQSAVEEIRADDATNANKIVADYRVFPLNRLQICFRAFVDSVEQDRSQFAHSSMRENVDLIDPALNKKVKIINQLDHFTNELQSICKSLANQAQITEHDIRLQDCLHQFIIEIFASLKSILFEMPTKYVKKYQRSVRTILIETIILIGGLYVKGLVASPLSNEATNIINALDEILSVVEDHQLVDKVVDSIKKQYNILLSSLLDNYQYIEWGDQQSENEPNDSVLINIAQIRKIFDSIENPKNKNEYYKIAVKIRSALVWINNCKVKINREIKKNKDTFDGNDYISQLFYPEGLEEVNAQIDKMQNIQDNLSEMQKLLHRSLGEINSIIYATELNNNLVYNSAEISNTNFVSQYKDLLNSDNRYVTHLNSNINNFYNGEEPRISFWDYVLPWRWSNYNVQLENSTKYQIQLILKNEVLSPLTHFSQIKNLIAQNKPAAWKWWASATEARERYENIERRAYFICLLKSFSTGYISERQLIQSLKEYKQSSNRADNHEPFISALLKKYQINLKSLDVSERLQIKSEHANSTKMISEFLTHYSTGNVDNIKDLDAMENVQSSSQATGAQSQDDLTDRSESSLNNESVTSLESVRATPSAR